MGIDKIELPKWLSDDIRRRRKAKKRDRIIKLFNFTINSTLIIIIAYTVLFLLAMKYTDVFAGETMTFENKIERVEVVKDKRIEATITAYSEIDSCHYENCIMASGNRAYIGAVACPREIELYTTVVVDGTPFVCEDRTDIKYNGRFDIFMGYGQNSYDKAIKFGKQERKVQILR
jgi:3D (Asp-Asp-Asp) domain-containing protein